VGSDIVGVERQCTFVHMAGDLFSKLPLDSCSGEPCCQPKVILPTSCSGDANRGTDGEVDQLVDLGKKSDMFR
jgi:hypothetical protein